MAALAPQPSSPPRPYAGVPASERAAQRRAKLMEAAFEVFGTQGYRLATKRLICAQARLADRYFHEHFDSVHACYVAVHGLACQEAASVVEQAVVAQPGDLLLRARAGLTAFFTHVQRDPRLARILIGDSSASGLTAENRIAQQYGGIIDLLRARFRQIYPNLIGLPNIDLVMTGCIGMVSHTAMLWIERGFDTSIDTLVDHNFYAWTGLNNWLSDLNQHSPGHHQ